MMSRLRSGQILVFSGGSRQTVPFLEELALEIASALVDSEVDGYEVWFLLTSSPLL